MREVNFSIPSVNKAAVNITTTLYDRRALDCTSTLPLINSLNHLAYLTTSSARIRDILTVDGGIEQLVCILKAGRSKDLMEMWKWNLAFQCVVNIGVRGSEAVRTRVVEADMVPVIATILDNYNRVVDRIRASSSSSAASSADSADSRKSKSSERSSSSFYDRAADNHRTTRRQAPPPSIEIPLPYAHDGPPTAANPPSAVTDVEPSPRIVLTSPPERTTFSQALRDGRRHRIVQPLATAVPSSADDPFQALRHDQHLQPRDGFHPGLTSQPESPTTPHGAAGVPQTHIPPLMPRIFPRRPPVRQQRSTSGESDDAQPDDNDNDNDITMADGDVDHRPEPNVADESLVDIDGAMDLGDINMQDMNMQDQDPLADTHHHHHHHHHHHQHASVTTPDTETFNLTHGSIPTPVPRTASPANTITAAAAAAAAIQPANQAPDVFNNPYPFYLQQNQNQTQPQPQPQPQPQDHAQAQAQDPSLSQQSQSPARGNPAGPTILAAMPRDEDVVLALQLLAYVSKYCNLRTYFQRTHLVPRLKIGKELDMLDDSLLPGSSSAPSTIPSSPPSNPASTSTITPADAAPTASLEEDPEETEEYILPDDYNIFPLVEKFTVRHHPKNTQYWACVVMRNLCRKDDARGGIRQCAYYQCGKWEEFQRQFAKCRRCRRAKYCSKECQKSAWVYHRHWCHSSPEH